MDTSDETSLLSALSYPYNESAADDRHIAEGVSDIWKWSSRRSGSARVLTLTRLTPAGLARTVTTVWLPFYFPWTDWLWCLATLVFLAAVYWLVRLSFSRTFLLNLVAPPPLKPPDPELDPARLMTDLPVNLLVIGPDTSPPIANLIHRSDVQVWEAEVLLHDTSDQAAGVAGPGTAAADPIALILSTDRSVVLRHFERLPDTTAAAAKAHATLMRILSALGNSVIIISSLDPILISAIEASERWRTLLHSFVRIDLHSRPDQRLSEDDAEYQRRLSAASYFHWLFAGMPKTAKLVMLQLAQESVVNPNSGEIVYDLMQEGMVERKWGLLTVRDGAFAKFLRHAVPHKTVKLWEREIAVTRPFSLQTSLLILGVGIVAFLIYTQGEVFNTWVTYATGVAAAVPKAIQFFDNFRLGKAAKT